MDLGWIRLYQVNNRTSEIEENMVQILKSKTDIYFLQNFKRSYIRI